MISINFTNLYHTFEVDFVTKYHISHLVSTIITGKIYNSVADLDDTAC